MNYSFIRYLEAKRPIDDRALNPQVWTALAAALPDRPLEILEVGAGIGTMVERLASRGLPDNSHYVALDSDIVNIEAARLRLAAGQRPFAVSLEAIDAFDYVDRLHDRPRSDLLIAHAFMDLFDLPEALPCLFSALIPGGLFYFTLNFDGLTVLEPVIDKAFDDEVMSLYHATMDERRINGRLSGDSRSGRHLLQLIPGTGGEILAAGSSDWVVFPRDGQYPGDEAYFLHHILHFIETSLRGKPELDDAIFGRWLARRHAQVESGELIYIAHQLDIAGRVPLSVAGA